MNLYYDGVVAFSEGAWSLVAFIRKVIAQSDVRG